MTSLANRGKLVLEGGYQQVLAHLAQETQEKLEGSGYFIDSRIIDDLRYSEEAESWTKPNDR